LLVISLDLDGTLFPNNLDDKLWFELIPRKIALSRHISIEDAKHYAINEYNSIGFTDPRWYIPEYWLDRFNLSIDIDTLLSEVNYKDYIYKDILALKDLDCKIVISSSNARSMLKHKVNAISSFSINIYRTFSVVTDLNITSKNIIFYKHVKEELGLEPYNIIHIGDNILYDLLNARASGLRSLLIDRSNNLKHPDVIHSLYDLKYIRPNSKI